MKRFFSPIVSVALAISLTVVSCVPNREEMDSIQNELAALKDKVAANEADVNAQLGTLQYLLQSYKDEVTPQLVALDTRLKKDYASLSDADEALSKALKSAQSALMAAISKNADDIAANKKDIQAAIAEYKKLVSDAVANFEAALQKAREDQAVVDGTQDLAIEALSSQFDTCKEAIDEAINNLGESVEELAAAVEEMEENVEDLQEKVDANFAASLAYTDALEASVKAAMDALEERIAANEAAIKKLNEETIPGIENTIETLQSSIEGLEGNLPALESKKLDKEVFAAFLKEHSEWKGSTDTSIQGINESIEELKAYDAILAGQVEYLTGLVNKLNGDETVEGSVQQQIKDKLTLVYKLIMEDLNALKTDLEGKMEDLENDVKGIQNVLALTWEEIAIINGNLDIAKNNIAVINGQIATAQGDMQKLREAKTELENRMAALQASIESRSKAIEELVAGLKDKVDIINGDKETEGSIAYAVEQLRASVQAQLAQLPEKVSKNAQEIAKLKEEMGKLQQYIQSLVFVPQYQDLKFGIPFTKIDDVYKPYDTGLGFAVVYKVAPAHLAKDLARAVNDAIAKGIDLPFNFDIDSDLQTRAADTNPQLIIKDAIGDEGTGKITFFLSHKNFDTTGGNLDKYTVSLRADNADYNVHVASEYVQAKLHLISSLTVIKDHLYKPNATTGEADSAIYIDGDDSTNEKTLDIEYIDGSTYVPFEGYELAAKDEKGVIRTYSQWKALGFEMPDVTVTATKISGPLVHLNADLKGASSTFAVKIKDGNNDNMKNTKFEIIEYKKEGNRYNFAFADGKNTFNAQCGVNIVKYKGDFQLKIISTIPWNYDCDAKVDHANKGLDPSAWTSSYVREYEYHFTPERYFSSDFVAQAYLVVGDEMFLIDGSNNALGLEPRILTGRDFTPAESLPSGTNLRICTSYYDDMIALSRFEIKERLGKTFEFTGTYSNPSNFLDRCFNTGNINATVVVKTVDRKTEDIVITAPERVVKLLGNDYESGDDFYDIGSASFTDALMAAYVKQGIFESDYTREDAFAGEFAPSNMQYTDATEMSVKFVVIPFATDSTFIIKSNAAAKSFKSSDLHKVAVNYENKPWALTVETYVGQKIKIHWPIRVVPKYDYRFVTNGSDTFQVPIEWVGGTSAITKAKTELELIRKDDASIKVMYKDGTVEKEVAYGDYGDSDIKLIPRFKLVNTTPGVDVDSTIVSGLPCASNVTYYSQTPSVGIKSALYVKSGNTEFLVPGSDQMYVGDTPVTSVNVKPSNPIAATQVNPVNPTIVDAGKGLVELTMQDILGNKLYELGHIQDNVGSYKDKIKNIFNSVKFSVYTVNGSSATAGWSIQGANSFGISDTPDDVILITNGIAAGPYTVVIKASTVWKDYYYTVKVNVQ